MNNKVFVALDGDNLFFSQRSLGWRIDLRKFRDYLCSLGEVCQSVYYISIHEDKEKSGFIKTLSRFGYTIITRPVKQIRQEDGSIKIKGSLDVKIAIDAIVSDHLYDVYVLVSGDSDFDCLIDTLKILGKKVWVVSSERTVSSELLECVGQNYIDFNSIREQIEREDEDENHDNGV